MAASRSPRLGGPARTKSRSTGVPSTLPIVCLPLSTNMLARYLHDEQSPEQAPQPSSSSLKTLPTTPTAAAKSFPAAGRETLPANKDVIPSTFPRATLSTVAPSSRTSPRRMQPPSLTRHPLTAAHRSGSWLLTWALASPWALLLRWRLRGNLRAQRM